MPHINTDHFVTVSEAARMEGITRQAMWARLKAGLSGWTDGLRSVVIAGRIHIRKTDLAKWRGGKAGRPKLAKVTI